MESLGSILNLKNIPVKQTDKVNMKWEKAQEFGDYIGIETKIVLRLFKKYGEGKVLSLRSWIKDYPADKRGKVGILIWKLKQK